MVVITVRATNSLLGTSPGPLSSGLFLFAHVSIRSVQADEGLVFLSLTVRP